MNPAVEPPADLAPAARAGSRSWLRQGENYLLSLVLTTMMVLPLAEIVLRKLFHFGIANSTALVQHLTLLVSMLGGAMAARDNRLLAMSPVPTLLKGKVKIAAALLSNSAAATVTFFLCVASVQFVLAEKPSGNILAYGVPFWIVQCILPFGYGLIAWRLLRHASQKWPGRFATFLLSGSLLLLEVHPPD